MTKRKKPIPQIPWEKSSEADLLRAIRSDEVMLVICKEAMHSPVPLSGKLLLHIGMAIIRAAQEVDPEIMQWVESGFHEPDERTH